LKSICSEALKEFSEEYRRSMNSVFPVVLDNNIMVDVSIIGDDVVETHMIKCDEDKLIVNSLFSGATSRAKSAGADAYRAFLEVVLKSNIVSGAAKFALDPLNFLVFSGVFPYKKLGEIKSVEEAREKMEGLVATAFFLRIAAVTWIASTLNKLNSIEEGQVEIEIEPLNLEEEAEKLKNMDEEERRRTAGILPIRF